MNDFRRGEDPTARMSGSFQKKALRQQMKFVCRKENAACAVSWHDLVQHAYGKNRRPREGEILPGGGEGGKLPGVHSIS